MQDNVPANFSWKRKRIAIEQITSQWSEMGRWWDGDVPYIFYEVLTRLGLFLLCRCEQEEMWYAKPVH